MAAEQRLGQLQLAPRLEEEQKVEVGLVPVLEVKGEPRPELQPEPQPEPEPEPQPGPEPEPEPQLEPEPELEGQWA